MKRKNRKIKQQKKIKEKKMMKKKTRNRKNLIEAEKEEENRKN